MKFKGRLDGFDELSKALKKLPDNMQKNVYQSAMRDGANVLKRAYRDAIPQGPGRHEQGHGRDTFKVKRLKADKTGARFVVYTKSYWLRFREYGRGVINAINGKKVLSDGTNIFGKQVKAQPARPAVRPAFDNNWELAFKKIGLSMSKGLLREAKKLSGEYKTAAKALGVRRK